MSLIRTAAWMLFGRWAFYFVTLISFSLIIRFISPSDYGVYVIAGTFLIFADVFFADAVENAVVRQAGDRSLVAHSAFWVVLGFSIVIALAISGLAYPLGFVYELDGLASLLIGISFVVIVQGLASVPRALLLRDGSPKSYALYSGFCNFIGAIVGVLAAYNGYGAWSLLMQQGALQLTMLILCSFSVRFFPALIFSRKIADEMFSFIKTSFWSCVLNVLANRLDIIFLGLYFESGDVGVYGLAKRLIQILQELVGSSFDKALVSFNAKKLLGGREGAYRQSVVAQALLLFPSFVGFAVVGYELITLFFGGKWAAASSIVSLMAIGGVFRSMVTIERAELVVQGMAQKILNVRFIELLIGLAFVVPFAHLGVAWMAAGFSLRYIIGYLLVVWSRFPKLDDFFTQLKTTCNWLLAIFMATVVMGGVGELASFSISGLSWITTVTFLCLVIPLCVVVYVAILFVARERMRKLLRGN
jgi:O-antigen/teichoic acid export membrane protein